MTIKFLTTEKLKQALAKEEYVNRDLAKRMIRYLDGRERGEITVDIPGLTPEMIRQLFFDFAIFCSIDLSDDGPDPKAHDWKRKSEWFGKDEVMTWASFGVHRQLISEGYDTDADEYYEEIDKRMRESFPDKF